MSALLQTVRFKECSNWSVAHLLESQFHYNQDYELVRIGDFLTRNKTQIIVQDDVEYKRVTIRLYNKGVALRDKVYGKDIGTKKQYLIKEGQFLLSKIDARNGAFGLATKEVDGAIITADFFAYDIDISKIEPLFLVLMTTTKKFMQFAQGASSGTTGRQRIDEKKFLDVKIPLPSLQKQKEIVEAYHSKIDLAKSQEEKAKKKEKEIEEYLFEELGIYNNINNDKSLLKFISFKDVDEWSYRGLFENNMLQSNKYEIIKFLEILKNISTGTTPPTAKKEYFNGNINFYTPSDIGINKDLFTAERKISKVAIDDKKARVFYKNTLLFVGIGSTTGKVAILKNNFASTNQQITGITIDENQANIDYVYYFLNMFKKVYLKNSQTSTIPIMNQEKIKDIQIILPPLEIQNKIVDYITREQQDINILKEQANENKLLALQKFEREIFDEA